jgi:hypothetical protein
MLFVGDVHSNFDDFAHIVQSHPDEVIIQVGDLGLARPWVGKNLVYNTVDFNLTGKWMFIRGNHDDPELCRAHPNYLGDYGYFGLPAGRIFFVSGARSIDYHLRIPTVDWWIEEELTREHAERAVEQYANNPPSIVVSHDCPDFLKDKFDASTFPSRTGWMLDRMFEIHQPRIWIFGHWHKNLEIQVKDTKFVCVAELSTYHLPT